MADGSTGLIARNYPGAVLVVGPLGGYDHLDSVRTRVPKESDEVTIKRLHEYYRTLRVVAIGLIITGSIYLTGYWAYEIIKLMQEPPWVTIVLTAIGVFVAPSALFLRMRRKFRRYIREDMQRTIELEKKLDPNRTSSGLTKDGRTPE